MLGRVWAWITALLSADTEREGYDEVGRFIHTPLDRSVRYAHGGSTDEVDRELADIEERALEIERQRRRE